MAVTLGLEALVRESQERLRMLEELARARDDVAAAEREAAVATERERLAREIHDTLAQGYSAIELLLRAAERTVGHDETRARAYIDQARTTAQENLAEARRFVRALAPADLDGATLVAALHRIADRTEATAATSPGADDEPRDAAPGSLMVRVETSGEPRALPLQVEAALVRIAQSALANVVQHAAARHATLTLSYLPDEVILDVVDDGRGFDQDRQPPPDRPGGFGLTATRSRARELGGSLAIESSPGDGTAVAVRLPAHDEDVPDQAPTTRPTQHQEDR
ncbi:MAG: sensor histidine kinase [Cellulomonas sp.]|nr:sensor histidine kinase [Cellulomonas sp.]MCR6648778.1 sensor histidine kinase [Cellulomonas sp.]